MPTPQVGSVLLPKKINSIQQIRTSMSMQEKKRLSRYRRALQFAQAQVMSKVLPHGVTALPRYTTDGVWQPLADEPAAALNGYLPGMLWQFAKLAGDPQFAQEAQRCSAQLESQIDCEPPAPGGLALSIALVPWHETTRDKRIAERLTEAGRRLGRHFHHRGRFFEASGQLNALSIGALPAVPLIQRAADATLDQDLARLVVAHGRTTRDRLVREDGSTWEQVTYDTEGGRFSKPAAVFGFSDSTTWSRGLAWSLLGFTRLYELTRATEFLRVAERNAEFWLTNVPPGEVPLWDLGLPDGSAATIHLDSSAAAIAASALLDIARLVPEPARAIVYRSMALATLDILVEPPYLRLDPDTSQGILRHGSYNARAGVGVDESLACGDYFLVEALTKVVKRAE